VRSDVTHAASVRSTITALPRRTAPPAASDRASFYLYNTLEEVDGLAEALAAVRKMFRR
jgi:selenocysteine lyase/cysteine desulfurase